MSENDLPDDKRPSYVVTPEMDSALQSHLDKLQKTLASAVQDLKSDPSAKSPQQGFEQYYKLKDIRQLNYPAANDKMLQMLQYYSQKMLNVLQTHATADAFNAGAHIYSNWMMAAGEHSYVYESDKIQEMIDKNAEWFVDGAATYNQELMAAKAIGLTFAMQDTLHDIRASEREELHERQKGFLIQRKKQEIADRLGVLDAIDERTAQYVAGTAPFIVNLPNATEDGLHAEYVDRTRQVWKDVSDDDILDQDKYDEEGQPTEEEGKALMSTVLHSYSYSEKAGELYAGALELLKTMGTARDVADFVFAVEPDLALTQMYKYRETTIIENKQNAEPRPYRRPDMQSSVDGMVYSMTALREKAPDRVKEFVGMNYQPVSEAYIDMGETASLINLYRAASVVAEGTNLDVRESFASRNLYQLVKQNDLNEAGIFLNGVHKKAGLPPTQMLVLLNENGDEIVAASVPLLKNGKAQSRASILYKPGQTSELAKIVYERPGANEYITYGAGERELELKNHFAQQVKAVSEKIQAKGITPEHTALSKRWLAIDCKNV